MEKVNPDLVVRDKEGKPYTVRYDAVNAMLLNEFLKEHHRVQDLKATGVERQKEIKTLTTGLEKVNSDSTEETRIAHGPQERIKRLTEATLAFATSVTLRTKIFPIG